MNALQMMLAEGRKRRKRAESVVKPTKSVAKPAEGVGGRGGRPREAGSLRSRARELGVAHTSIQGWMKRKGCTLEEAVEHYRARNAAMEKPQAATAREARVAEAVRSIEEAQQAQRERETRAAEEIMRILYE